MVARKIGEQRNFDVAARDRLAQANFILLTDEIAADGLECVKAGASILHIHVRDANGDTPQGYLPDQLDPTGRQVSINFRKLF